MLVVKKGPSYPHAGGEVSVMFRHNDDGLAPVLESAPKQVFFKDVFGLF